LPPETAVWCGHDYLDKNARFALTVDSGNDALRGRANHAVSMRAAGTLSPPSTIGEELATNPFLRWDSPAVRAALGMESASDLDVFTELRQRRNAF
jgi:hydroxyacylglutathione hydrolase